MIPTNRCTCSKLGTHLGNKLPVLLVQVGCGRHVILPDTDFALLRGSGKGHNPPAYEGEFQHFPSADGSFKRESAQAEQNAAFRLSHRSAARSFSAPCVYTAMDQSTQRAKPSFSRSSVMLPF